MISRKDFLALVLPSLEEGESYCTVGIKEDGEDKDVRQRFVHSIEGISEHADEYVVSKYNAFYGMAKYGPEDRRTTKNAIALKSFYIDLDCGTGKPFADLSEGLLALRAFCKLTGLPRPTIVKSGTGAHLYWVCEEALPREKWSLYAEQLKALCVQHKFDVDPVVTGEAARILRIPETYHVKDPTNPILVEVLHVAPQLSCDDVHKLLEPSFEVMAAANKQQYKRQLDPVTLALMGNKEAKFKDLLVMSLEGKGCAQIAHIYNERATLSYDMWRGGLSIAQKCSDRDKAIHILSKGHPDYSPEATEKMANGTNGPYTCERFRLLNPVGCEGCPHKIVTPIALAERVVEAPADTVVTAVEEVTKEVKQYAIPKFPFPFFRGKNGGVYYKTTRKAKDDDDDDQEVDELLYRYDFYVVKRMVDPDLLDTILCRLHTPKDGVRDFIMPNTTIVSKDKFMATIAPQGLVILGKKQDMMMQYVKSWVDELMKEKAEKAHRQFGWTEDDSSIIIGEREIKATEVLYSPPSAPTLPNIHYFQPKGDFHVWKNIINHYGKPGMENRAFAFFLGFGIPLMRFTALDGFLVNLMSRNSGSGKTTILHAINSIYGRPKELTLAPKDTYNVRMNRLGVMQNLAVTMDEITNMPAEDMSNQVYDVTSGRAKHRLKQHDNVERNNNTKFQTGVISSSNRSVMDVLLSIKGFPDGELKRVLEVTVEAEEGADATWSRDHFERLMENYGHAAEPYFQAVIAQLPAVKDLLSKTRDKVDLAANVRPSERFWSLIVALSVTGGLIAKKLGLHDIPVQPVFDYGVRLIKETRIKSREYMFDGDEFLGVFFQHHFNEVLVINAKTDKRTGLEQGPIKEPRNAMTMRYEPDTKMLYVSATAYRTECNKRSMNFEETLKPYIKCKALVVHPGGLTTKRKKMFVGTTASNTAATTCLWFDTTKLDFFNEDVLINAVPDEDLQPPSSG
jgi:hypothetical protein